MPTGSRLLHRPRDVRRWRRALREPRVRLACAWALVAGVEFFGRLMAWRDVHDLAALPFLALAAYLIQGAVREMRLVWPRAVRDVGRWIAQRWRTLQYDVGVDLRHTPAIGRAMPPDVALVILGLPILCAALAGLTFQLASVPRLAARFSYVVHTLGLTVVWSLLLGLSALLVAIVAAHIHDFFANHYAGARPRPRRAEALCDIAAVTVTTLAAIFLPRWLPFVLIGLAAVLALGLVWNPWTPRLTMLWRSKRGGRVAAVDWRWTQSRWISLVTWTAAGVLILSFGPTVLGLAPGGDVLPVTRVLWSITAWVAAFGLLIISTAFCHWAIENVRVDPARPSPTTIHVTGRDFDRAALLDIAAARGWRLRFAPAQPAPLDVRIRVVPSPMPRLETPPSFPIPVSQRALELAELQDVLARFDLDVRRAALLAGFERLFRHAARRKFARGAGYWLAPHLWFFSGMSRDVDEDDDNEGGVITQLVGPVFTKVFARPARQHLHTVMTALEVDLIFVEDGVRFEDFRQVLMRIFAHYDGGVAPLRLEDRHLSAIHGIRVIVHDHDMDTSFKARGYPEPDYEDLARARILHVFRDRGEDDEPSLPPFDWDGLLVPLQT